MDLLAHLIGWDYANLEAISALEAGDTPPFYVHQDAGWGTYNKALVERYGSADWQALRSAIDTSGRAVEARLRALPAEDLTRQHHLTGRSRPATIAGILRAAIRDEQEHLDQLRAYAASTS